MNDRPKLWADETVSYPKKVRWGESPMKSKKCKVKPKSRLVTLVFDSAKESSHSPWILLSSPNSLSFLSLGMVGLDH